jgi:hypothetical protein
MEMDATSMSMPPEKPMRDEPQLGQRAVISEATAAWPQAAQSTRTGSNSIRKAAPASGVPSFTASKADRRSDGTI